jgi:hypothetical protein
MSERAEEIARELEYLSVSTFGRPARAMYEAASTIRSLIAELKEARGVIDARTETCTQLSLQAEAAESSLSSLRERVRGVLEPFRRMGDYLVDVDSDLVITSSWPRMKKGHENYYLATRDLRAVREFLSTLPHDGEG